MRAKPRKVFRACVDFIARWAAVILVGVGLAAAIALAVQAAVWTTGEPQSEAEPEPIRPMPCIEDQVYVWDDYPVSAHCVWNEDHAGHTP